MVFRNAAAAVFHYEVCAVLASLLANYENTFCSFSISFSVDISGCFLNEVLISINGQRYANMEF